MRAEMMSHADGERVHVRGEREGARTARARRKGVRASGTARRSGCGGNAAAAAGDGPFGRARWTRVAARIECPGRTSEAGDVDVVASLLLFGCRSLSFLARRSSHPFLVSLNSPH
jgi:hypothetical protein